MDGLEAVTDAAAWVGTGAGAGAGFFFVRWLAVFMSSRWDKKEEQIDAGTQQVIALLREENTRLSESEKQTRAEMAAMRAEFGSRMDGMERALRECERRHAEADAAQMQLRAMLQGSGDAKQHAALIVAAEKKAEKGEG